MGLPSNYVYKGIIHTYVNGIHVPVDFSSILDCSFQPPILSGVNNISSNKQSIEKSDLVILPNPHHNKFDIQLDINGYDLFIYSCQGNLIRESYNLSGNQEINWDAPPGIYYVIVVSSDMSYSQKIIKI